MKYLLNKYKNIKKTRKGFTLVELLVVIAILAVLASVSVVGYLGFTTKAKNSNALTELSQAREVIRLELLDGSKSYEISSSSAITEETTTSTDTSKYTLTFNYGKSSTNTSKYILTYSVKISSETTSTTLTDYKWDTVLKACFTDLATLNGEFEVEATTGTISSVKYFPENGGSALWTIATDELKSGDQTKSATNVIKNYSTENK